MYTSLSTRERGCPSYRTTLASLVVADAVIALSVVIYLVTTAGSDGDLRRAEHVPEYDRSGDFAPLTAREIQWNATMVIATDMWEREGDVFSRANEFLSFARAEGALIVHACYNCTIPFSEKSTDRVLCEAAGVPCGVPPMADPRPYMIDDRHRFLVPWPFASKNRNGHPAPDRPYYPGFQGCVGPAGSARDCRDNSVRAGSGSQRLHPGVEVYANDVFTEDWIWRVIVHRGIRNLAVVGQDANECILHTRPTSILTLIGRGWDPDRLFTVPYATRSRYRIRGAPGVPWDDLGSAVWARAVWNRFGVRAIEFPDDARG